MAVSCLSPSLPTAIKYLFWVLPAVAGLLILFVWDPALERFFPRCPLHLFTGYYCAGCGSLRALHQMLDGHFYAAFRLNPLLPAALSVMSILLVRPDWALKRWVPWAALAVLLAYSLLRNVPSWPCNLMAPTVLP